MFFSKYAKFVIGSVLFALLIVTVFIFNTRGQLIDRLPKESESVFVYTDDPMVTRQLTNEDLLPTDLPLVTFIDPKRGSENPRIDLVEFSDFGCPFCKTSQEIIKKILNAYPRLVRHVWKDAPNEKLHPGTTKAHLAARCAQKQNKFWEYHDQLFSEQNNFSAARLKNIAKIIGLDTKKWQSCFEEQAERAKIERGLMEAEALGVDGTPYFFINNQKISGSISYEEMQQLIINELSAP